MRRMLAAILLLTLAATMVPSVSHASSESLLVPDGVELSDDELGEVRGQLWQGAVLGAVTSAATKIVQNVRNDEPWHAGVPEAAALGALGGAIAGGTLMKTVVSKGLTHAKVVVDWIAVGRAAASGAVTGALSD